MLEIIYKGCCLKVVNYIFCNDMFHSFSNEKDWYVIHFISFNFSPFIYIDICSCDICMFPVIQLRLFSEKNYGKNWCCILIFQKYSASNVGSLALCGLILNKNLCMPGEASQTRMLKLDVHVYYFLFQ